MLAAYYDLKAEQGATFHFKITLSDSEGKSLNLKGDDSGIIPISNVPVEFQDRFLITNSEGQLESIAKAYIRMQVRNTFDGEVIPVDPPSIQNTNTDDGLALFGVAGYEYDNNFFPINIELGDGGENKDEPNISITIDAIYMEGIRYGKPVYGIDIVFAQDMLDHPKKVVYRLMQGKFMISPNVTR